MTTQPDWWNYRDDARIQSYGPMRRETDFGSISGEIGPLHPGPVNLSVPYFPQSVDIKSNMFPSPYMLVKGPEVILQSVDWTDIFNKALPLIIGSLVVAIVAPIIRDLVTRKKPPVAPVIVPSHVAPSHTTSVVFER